MRAHYEAFKALLEGQPELAGRVYLGVRKVSGKVVRENYVVAKMTAPNLGDMRYVGIQRADSRAKYRFDVRVVATTGDWLLDMTSSALRVVGERPSVSGRRCDPLALVGSVEEGEQEYDQVSDLYFMDLSFEFVSRRA